MAFTEKTQKIPLPETQEILSQMTDDDSQSFSMEQEVTAPIWAKLIYLPNPRIIVGKTVKLLSEFL